MAEHILAFDTSGPYCAAALLRGDEVLATTVEDMARGQAERLMDLLNETLAAHDLAWRDLTALGVGVGPGNFTGIRISVAAARGLAMGLGIPAVGVSTFEASLEDSQNTALALPAPRDSFYVQVFQDGVAAAAAQHLPALPDSSQARILSPKPGDLVTNIARCALARHATNPGAPKPLYVKAPDAAPAKEAGPKILT
ncbi:MAG: tRNA (adenosine(37)-N6)-threonylcarbamoyltransferase complex dimerization subunit type 1 TsaB [Rhodobacteraceae bacterium]|nr:tRNA (adenosine(37)-N6)-threonylcarbamoyltransferase complex dimerization subunit type 1 TsaB [Paracoccaceae bacterium]